MTFSDEKGKRALGRFEPTIVCSDRTRPRVPMQDASASVEPIYADVLSAAAAFATSAASAACTAFATCAAICRTDAIPCRKEAETFGTRLRATEQVERCTVTGTESKATLNKGHRILRRAT